MAIAHVAKEYVFSDFLLKDPNQARYRSVRTELAVDKIVTCVAVGLPLVLISLTFAQEVSVGAQISCFAPSNFSWRQAAYVDSFCWAVVHTHTLPMWLHKFFPYILLLVAVLMYTPALLWRFTAVPFLQSDLCFIMEELDRCYNRAVTQAKETATAGQLTADSIPTEGCYNYPVVKKFLETKHCSRKLLLCYMLCRFLTLITLLCACVYLGCYLHLASPKDEFSCTLRVGLLKTDPGVPDKVQCKLIAVGVFYLLSLVNLIVFAALIPVVIYASLRPLFYYKYAHFLEIYESLPAVTVLPKAGSQCDDLLLYLLLLDENISELKSYKYMKVLEMLRRRGESFDPMGVLRNLCPVKMDSVDGKNPNADAAERDAEAPEDGCERPDPSKENSTKMETEMKEIKPLLKDNNDAAGGRYSEGGALRQRPT